MDLLAKTFQGLWHAVKSKEVAPGIVFLEDQSKRLEIISESVLNTSRSIQVVGSEQYIGSQGQTLFLPVKIDIFSSVELNQKLYLNLTLLSSVAIRKQMVNRWEKDSPIMERMRFLQTMGILNQELDQLFNGFYSFQEEIFNKLKFELKLSGNIADFWLENYLRRSDSLISLPDKILNLKKNEDIPLFLLYTTPCLVRKDSSELRTKSTVGEKRQNTKIQTEKKNPNPNLGERVDLEKEKINPVTHSFEKMETADDYSGGRKMDSGDDELEDHSEALEELSLSKYTINGESAKSVYQADTLMISSASFEDENLQKENKVIFYPEWNCRKSCYLKNHCRILVDPDQLTPVTNSYKETLEKKYGFQIKIWKRKVESLLSEPLWLRRQKEGDDLDYDEVVRDFVYITRKMTPDARWYIQRRRRTKEAAVMILFDQSMSADSWVKNQRVLDLILESIGVVGLIFDKILNEVYVAGCWSSTRNYCAFQTYKSSNEGWDQYYNHVAGIEAKGYTRLGPAIRHASSILDNSKAKKKLLLILTDGKPTDLDGYEGQHGIQDVRQACREAEAAKILPYALTIDEISKQHFSKMFRHFSLLQKPQDLLPRLLECLILLLNDD